MIDESFPTSSSEVENEKQKRRPSTRFSNFKVRLDAGSKAFWIDSIVLSSQSPVAKPLLDNRTGHLVWKKIRILNCTAEVAKKFLHHLCTGGDLSLQDAIDLINIATTFEVFKLKYDCMNLIIKNLIEENAISVLKIGNDNDIKIINHAAFAKIKTNYPNDIWQEKHRSVVVKVIKSEEISLEIVM